MTCSVSGGTLQVPLSLSPDGRYFTVLRTLFGLDPKAGTLSYTAHVVPLKVDNFNKGFWQVPKMMSWKPDPQRIYLYWFYFDDRGGYLCFVERTHSSPLTVSVIDLGKHGKGSLTFVAKNELFLPKQKLDPLYHHPRRDRGEFELAFHPYLPIIAVAELSGTFIWNFTPRYLLPRSGFVRLESDVGEGGGKVEMLSFSSDGNYCIMKRRGRLAIVYNIGGKLPSAEKSSTVVSSVATGSRPTVALSKLSPLTVTPHAPGTIRAGSCATTVQGKSAREIVLANAGREVSLSSYSDSGGGSPQSLTLTRIPRLPGSNDIIPGVVFPSSPNDPVKIVLDKGSATTNRIVASQTQTIYPAVMERHISSIWRSHQAQTMRLPRNESFFMISEGDKPVEDTPLPVPDQNQTDTNKDLDGKPTNFNSSGLQIMENVAGPIFQTHEDATADICGALISGVPSKQCKDGIKELSSLASVKESASIKRPGWKYRWSLRRLRRQMH